MTRNMTAGFALAGALVAAALSAPSAGSPDNESVSYTYDLRGRLTKATYSGGGDDYYSSYEYDNVDNRKTAKVSNSAHGNQPYIVVPGGGTELMSLDPDAQPASAGAEEGGSNDAGE